MSRTASQVLANKIDLELFRLLCQAEEQKGQRWSNLATALRRARTHARVEMHPEDRQATEGVSNLTNQGDNNGSFATSSDSDETTVQLRKGDVIAESDIGPVHVTPIDMMPHVDEANPDLQKVDCHFLYVGVDKKIAETRRGELIEILKSWPDPSVLAGGPSYITVGAEIGDQGAAFQLFALGKTLGLWDIITPATFHMTGAEADRAAGAGYIMMSGFDANKY